MKARDIEKAGIPVGPLVKLAMGLLGPAAQAGLKKKQMAHRLSQVAAEPDKFVDDALFGALAQALMAHAAGPPSFAQRSEPAPWRMWGSDLDPAAVEQMRNACLLPVAVQGGLMPDAHLGYGLPIGGVLAADNAVIPYGVGVDIACRMMLTVTDMPVHSLDRHRDELCRVLEDRTLFGSGGAFPRPHDHPVMHQDWDFCQVVKQVRDKAQGQLGTSGSGNHFVEYGLLAVHQDMPELPAGEYLAILSHSGSRGPGAVIADHYWKLAMELRPDLPKNLRHLAWLDLDSDPGREYWQAMRLMGEFAAANHEIIHQGIVRDLKAGVLLRMENHHNFAWIETHGGREVVVHRKGATPAGAGMLGVIPGSMGTPGFLVRGRGEPGSLDSASHGAGRLMSRTEARNCFAWSNVRKELTAADITVLSAGVDECPGAYKDIQEVMRHQEDLVEILARFSPKIVKMDKGQ